MKINRKYLSALKHFNRVDLWQKISRFFFAPASARPLAMLRISLATTLLAQAWLVSGDLYELYGRTGVLQELLSRTLVDPTLPRLSWFIPVFERFGVTEQNAIFLTSVSYLVSLVGLLVGIFTHFSALLAWLLHWVLMNTGNQTNYGADTYAHIFLFYLIWMPSGLVLSVDSLRKGATSSSSLARLSLRVIQIHLCISYLCSGIEKSLGPQWWNGEVIWRALSLPVYQQIDMTWLAFYPLLAQVLSLGTLLVEIGYPVFIWPAKSRTLWIFLILSLHLGIAIFLGLHIFGILMAFLTFCAFGVSADPKLKMSFSMVSRDPEQGFGERIVTLSH